MKERPILFSAPMVRAILDGSKTQTRRVMRPQMVYGNVCGIFPSWYLPTGPDSGTLWPNGKEKILSMCPFGHPGDRLWVRETYFAYGRWETRFSSKNGRDEWHFIDMTVECDRIYQFAADNPDVPVRTSRHGGASPGWWKRPAIHMPRAVSRTSLEITGVRVERLNSISDEDAEAEGIDFLRRVPDVDETLTPRDLFMCLWDSVATVGADWKSNPWVWGVDFNRIDAKDRS